MIAIYFYQVFFYGGQSLHTFCSFLILANQSFDFLPLIKLKNVITVVWLDRDTQNSLDHAFSNKKKVDIQSASARVWTVRGGTMQALSWQSPRDVPINCCLPRNPFTNTDTFFMFTFLIWAHWIFSFFFVKFPTLLFFPFFLKEFLWVFPCGAHSYLPTRAK